MVRYFDKDGYKTDEENAFIKLEEKKDIVEASKRVDGNWIVQWRVKGCTFKDVRIFAGDAKKVQQEAIERDRKARND